MTIRDAQTKYPSLYENALIAELKQFHNMEVGKPILHPPSDLKHKKIIGMNGFFKEVFDLRTGSLKKLKFRIVPQGHLLDRSLYAPKEMTSPTVAMESVFAAINIAAVENRRGFTMDIPGAYLNADLKDKHVVRFPKDLAAEYIKIYPKYSSYLQPNGTMFLLIEKALYGLVESSALWCEEIKNFLLNYITKFIPVIKGSSKRLHPVEKSPFAYILGWSTNSQLVHELEQDVRNKYGDARFDDSSILNYIGMTITQPKQAKYL